MPIPHRQSKVDDTSIPELIELVKTYAKQETIDPLRGVGRWIAFGAAGAACLGIGLIVLLLGVLRLLETEWTRAASGSLSWLPYLITLLVAAILLAVTVLQIRKSSIHREPK